MLKIYLCVVASTFLICERYNIILVTKTVPEYNRLCTKGCGATLKEQKNSRIVMELTKGAHLVLFLGALGK